MVAQFTILMFQSVVYVCLAVSVIDPPKITDTDVRHSLEAWYHMYAPNPSVNEWLVT